MASVWFWGWAPLAVVLAFVIALLGFVLDFLARRKLDGGDPVGFRRRLEWWLLVPFAIGAVAAAVAIVLAVEFNAGKDASVEREKILSAFVAALGAFLTAAFIKGAEEADDNWVGMRFKKLFQAHYNPKFKAGEPTTDAELAVRSEAALGFSGWGRAARKRRAEIVAANPPT